MVEWVFDVSVWKKLPLQLSDDILKMVLGHVPADPLCVPSAPTEHPRKFRALPNGTWTDYVKLLRVQVSSNRKFISATLIQGTVVWRCKARCWAYDIEDNERQLTELEYAMLLQMLSNQIRMATAVHDASQENKDLCIEALFGVRCVLYILA